MKKIIDSKKYRVVDLVIFIIGLMAANAYTVKLFYRQAMYSGGGWQSDLPSYIEEIQGINERYSVAIEAKERGETIRTIEWLQIALAANDVNNHLALKGLIRFMLSNYNEVDEAGQQINMQEEIITQNPAKSMNKMTKIIVNQTTQSKIDNQDAIITQKPTDWKDKATENIDEQITQK